MDRHGNDRSPVDATEIARRIDEVETRIEAGDYHGAVRAAELLASEVPDDPDVLSSLARARLAAGDSDSAADACAKLLSLSPEYAEAARLLEECRLVSPAESSLGSVTVRGGEPDDPPVPPEPPAQDPAALALRQRVDDLLSQARMAASHGRNEEALGLLSRLLILDDQNDEALAFEEELRSKAGAEARSFDDWLSEGVQCLEQGRFEDARQLFLKVLERSPGHSEALDFLEKADAQLALLEEERAHKPPAAPVRRATAPAPPTAQSPAQSETTHAHVWTPAAATPDAPAHEPAPVLVDDLFSPGFELEASPEPVDEEAAEAEVAETVSAPRPRRRRMVLIAAGVLLVAAGGFAAWKLLGGGSSAVPEEEATVAVPKAAVAKVPASATKPSGASAPAGELSAEERSKRLARTLARASDAFEAADYEGAILAYNDALALDPANAAARQGILDAGERYKAHKAQAALFDKVRRAFDAGEYESGLRMLYRLPEDAAEPATLVRYKIAGWYNMGVIALRAADCAHAQDHFKEALALQPGDAALREARSLAERCSGQRKDRAFYDTAEALPFRSADR